MKNALILLISIFFFSCQQKDSAKTAVPASDTIVAKDSVITKKTIVENKQTGDTILMNVKDEKGFYTAEGSLDSIHPRVYVKFKNENLGE
ncbi:hypothetical protein AB9T88_18915, partial [Flavobacterium sp. LBUM151]